MSEFSRFLLHFGPKMHQIALKSPQIDPSKHGDSRAHHPLSTAHARRPLTPENCNLNLALEVEELAEALGLGTADRNFGLLLVVHA